MMEKIDERGRPRGRVVHEAGGPFMAQRDPEHIKGTGSITWAVCRAWALREAGEPIPPMLPEGLVWDEDAASVSPRG